MRAVWSGTGESRLKDEFEDLLQLLRPEDSVDKEDIAIMKKQVFGPNTFWVTDTRLTTELTDGINGLLVLGNLRGDHSKAFDLVEAAMKKAFGAFHHACLPGGMLCLACSTVLTQRLDCCCRAVCSQLRTPVNQGSVEV